MEAFYDRLHSPAGNSLFPSANARWTKNIIFTLVAFLLTSTILLTSCLSPISCTILRSENDDLLLIHPFMVHSWNCNLRESHQCRSYWNTNTCHSDTGNHILFNVSEIYYLTLLVVPHTIHWEHNCHNVYGHKCCHLVLSLSHI